MGQREEGMITIGSKYYDAAYASIGLKELEILYTQIFTNHLEFGNNDIIVWEAVQLESYKDVGVEDVSVCCIILA